MTFKLIGVAAVLLMLSACGSKPSTTMAATSGGSADTSGMSTTGGTSGGISSSDLGSGGMSNGTTPGSQEDLVVSAGDRVLFGFDRYDISPEGQQTLQMQAEWLRRYPQVAVVIEGHADERGTREYNLALGERRASSAKNFLVALGIEESRIATVSFGKERPAVVGGNDEAWAQNRRAVTTVQ
jgi:peptidoglycan-associated lipoprotein